MIRRRLALIAAAGVAWSCEGQGVDVEYSRSNCPWEATADFAGAGFRLFHREPSACPWPKAVGPPYFAEQRYYEAIVTGPYSTNAATLATTFYDAKYSAVDELTSVFRDVNDRLEAQPIGYYLAASVPVALGETRSDHAQNSPYPGSGYGVVDLTYHGSPVVILASEEVNENEVFTLTANVDAAFEGTSYNWYQDDVLVAGPTTNHQYTTALAGSGVSVVFRVDVSNARAETGSATHSVYIVPPEGCAPPCVEP